MTETPSTKEIGNLLYHSAILSGLTVGYSMLGKKLLNLNIKSPANSDLMDALKLTGAVTAAMVTRDWLVKSKILPPDI